MEHGTAEYGAWVTYFLSVLFLSYQMKLDRFSPIMQILSLDQVLLVLPFLGGGPSRESRPVIRSLGRRCRKWFCCWWRYRELHAEFKTKVRKIFESKIGIFENKKIHVFCQKYKFLLTIFDFWTNFDFWPKFWFLTKILIFGLISIFDQNFDFWP